ncbi:MAG: YggS family pyridoxal phosphate-dependent enzyme [bacterium]|nr:YggS family pyridoxal phosphate-dependent enzyme [bacterium]
MSLILENLERTQERIAAAAARSGRDASDVTLVVVSKTQSVDVIQEAVDAGVRVLGENRIQEAEEKAGSVKGDVAWHLVGHLQRNKVKNALALFDLIHSVDHVRLAKEIGKRAVQNEQVGRVLVQVNTSGSESQFGVAPEEALDLIGQISQIEGVGVEGLMTIGVFSPDPEAVRPCFVRLRNLCDEVEAAGLPGVSMRHLSMGMTGDFEVAVEEGATLVRVGTAIFGARN